MIRRAIKSALRAGGFELRRIQGAEAPAQEQAVDPVQQQRVSRALAAGIANVHYGCGPNLMAGWLNVDWYPHDPAPDLHYVRTDITERHPFPDGCFRFAYCEDVLEHLKQEASLRFLVEIRRCLADGGVARLSYPSFESVLETYRAGTFEAAQVGRHQCYDMWEHVHFYSREALALVANRLGFSDIAFRSHGESPHAALQNIDTRIDQAHMNTFAELTR